MTRVAVRVLLRRIIKSNASVQGTTRRCKMVSISYNKQLQQIYNTTPPAVEKSPANTHRCMPAAIASRTAETPRNALNHIRSISTRYALRPTQFLSLTSPGPTSPPPKRTSTWTRRRLSNKISHTVQTHTQPRLTYPSPDALHRPLQLNAHLPSHQSNS